MNFLRIKDLNSPLYRNAILLIINSVVLSGFGFLFWTIVVRLFPVEEVGLATALLSSLELILVISLAGFNIALVRYLPRSKEKEKLVSSCFLISGIIALLISSIFILGLDVFSPRLSFLKEVKVYSIIYVISSISYVIFTLIDAVFIAHREAKFVVLKNLIFGILKLILPFLLIFLGTVGIFLSVEISAAVALATSLIIGSIFVNLKLVFAINKEIIRDMLRFSVSNYVANIFFYAPTLTLPLIITNLINPETAAYFYFSMMILGLISIVPTSIAQSLLAEGAHSSRNIKTKVKKAFKFSYLLLIPCVILVLIFGKYLLLLFGKTYSENSFRFLQLLACSSLFSAINIIYIAIKNIQHKVKMVIFISFIISASILVLSLLLIKYGLIGIGIAWILGQLIANCFVLVDVIRTREEYGI